MKRWNPRSEVGIRARASISDCGDGIRTGTATLFSNSEPPFRRPYRWGCNRAGCRTSKGLLRRRVFGARDRRTGPDCTQQHSGRPAAPSDPHARQRADRFIVFWILRQMLLEPGSLCYAYVRRAIRPQGARRSEDAMNEARPLTAADTNLSRGGAGGRTHGARCRARSVTAPAGSSTRPTSAALPGLRRAGQVLFRLLSPVTP